MPGRRGVRLGSKGVTSGFVTQIFMKELQRLLAKEYLQGFEELGKLAGHCQETRNDLGPLEDEGIKAEQQFEAKILKLQQAEESLYRQFIVLSGGV
jgi:hypothetical protein